MGSAAVALPHGLCCGHSATVTLACLPQSAAPGCIHSVLLLAEKELPAHRERVPGAQVSPSLSLPLPPHCLLREQQS